MGVLSYPNYFGEICFGQLPHACRMVAKDHPDNASYCDLSGTYRVVSTVVSGVPMLEAGAKRRFGSEHYSSNTPILIYNPFQLLRVVEVR